MMFCTVPSTDDTVWFLGMCMAMDMCCDAACMKGMKSLAKRWWLLTVARTDRGIFCVVVVFVEFLFMDTTRASSWYMTKTM